MAIDEHTPSLSASDLLAAYQAIRSVIRAQEAEVEAGHILGMRLPGLRAARRHIKAALTILEEREEDGNTSARYVLGEAVE